MMSAIDQQDKRILEMRNELQNLKSRIDCATRKIVTKSAPYLVADRFEFAMQLAFGGEWTMHKVLILSLWFEDEKSDRLPLTPYADVADENSEPVDIELFRYRENIDLWNAQPEMRPLPVTYHAAMLHRIAKALRNIGLTVSITYK